MSRIDLEKYNTAFPREAREVIYKIMQEDMNLMEQFLEELYRRGWRLQRLGEDE